MEDTLKSEGTVEKGLYNGEEAGDGFRESNPDPNSGPSGGRFLRVSKTSIMSPTSFSTQERALGVKTSRKAYSMGYAGQAKSVEPGTSPKTGVFVK